jgi:hypothetical protein
VEDESLFEDSSSDEEFDEDCGCTGSALEINILLKEENLILTVSSFYSLVCVRTVDAQDPHWE